MSDDEAITAPVSLVISTEREATLTFGPMALKDLGDMLDHLGTAAGYMSFLGHLDAAIEQEITRPRGPK